MRQLARLLPIMGEFNGFSYLQALAGLVSVLDWKVIQTVLRQAIDALKDKDKFMDKVTMEVTVMRRLITLFRLFYAL